MHQRLQNCRDRCTKYNLEQPDLLAKAIGAVSAHEKAPVSKRATFAPVNLGPADDFNRSSLISENNYLKEMVEALQHDLQTAENEIVEAQQELFNAVSFGSGVICFDNLTFDEILPQMQERDKTPAALLFFALLHDPTYIESLQQLIKQIGHLKQ